MVNKLIKYKINGVFVTGNIMEITWLGQAGLLFETEGKKIIVDPYLSDSVEKVQPQNYRRIAVDKSFLDIKPNIILLTHSHIDHMDNETLCHYLDAESSVSVFSPYSVWKEVRKFGGLKNNYVLFNSGTSWTEGETVFRAVKAEHSDEYAIGIIITSCGRNYYITGDTLYSEKVFESLPNIEFDTVFLPINGVGNNMNVTDAIKFAERIKAKKVIPLHYGMFDCIDPVNIDLPNKKILNIYQKENF